MQLEQLQVDSVVKENVHTHFTSLHVHSLTDRLTDILSKVDSFLGFKNTSALDMGSHYAEVKHSSHAHMHNYH